MKLKNKFLINFSVITSVIFFCLHSPLIAQEESIANSIFIPVYQSFDFQREKIVDIDKGDIAIQPYGIDVVELNIEIAKLDKGFIEDMNILPEEAVIEWTNFEDYAIDMVYAVRDPQDRCTVFELIDVVVVDNQATGIEILYKHIPCTGSSFKPGETL
ncbi:hypothetical protein ACFL2J_04900 [Candidatus Omnitrophota bacterium]